MKVFDFQHVFQIRSELLGQDKSSNLFSLEHNMRCIKLYVRKVLEGLVPGLHIKIISR